MVRRALGVRISPYTAGGAPGTSSSLAFTPRFSKIFTMASALRRTLGASEARLGIVNRSKNSETMACSWAWRQERAAWAAGEVWLSPAGAKRNRISHGTTRMFTDFHCGRFIETKAE